MDLRMKGIRFPLVSVTAFLVVYAVLAWFAFDTAVLAMFAVSPFLVLWVIYRVLKDGQPSGRSFNEHFYDDWDYKRIADRD